MSWRSQLIGRSGEIGQAQGLGENATVLTVPPETVATDWFSETHYCYVKQAVLCMGPPSAYAKSFFSLVPPIKCNLSF